MLADECRRHLCRLIPLFGVGRQRELILEAFDLLAGESLAIEPWQRSPERSRINADGTPFQLALDLHEDRRPALQFLGEAGRLDGRAAERRAVSLAALQALARICGLEAETAATTPLVDALVSAPGPSPLPTSLLWFALRFASDRPAALTIYVNGAWGPEAACWRRFDRLAESVASEARWRALRPVVEPLAPLGASITIRCAATPSARVYLRGYGRRAAWYRTALAAAAGGETAAAEFDACAAAILGPAVAQPTQSVVFSADLAADADAGAKVEFCGHCAFDDDDDAARHIDPWLRARRLDHTSYHHVVAAITGGRPVPPTARRAALHAFVGVGVRGSGPYASIYLNPGAVLGRAS